MGLKEKDMSEIQLLRCERLSRAISDKLIERRARVLASMAQRGLEPETLAYEFEAQFRALDAEMNNMKAALELLDARSCA